MGRTMRNKLFYLLAFFFVTGCACGPEYIDNTCLIVRPIMISKNDKLTNETLRQIYELNILLKEYCD